MNGLADWYVFWRLVGTAFWIGFLCGAVGLAIVVRYYERRNK